MIASSFFPVSKLSDSVERSLKAAATNSVKLEAGLTVAKVVWKLGCRNLELADCGLRASSFDTSIVNN
jgi:hypothetical protein